MVSSGDIFITLPLNWLAQLSPIFLSPSQKPYFLYQAQGMRAWASYQMATHMAFRMDSFSVFRLHVIVVRGKWWRYDLSSTRHILPLPPSPPSIGGAHLLCTYLREYISNPKTLFSSFLWIIHWIRAFQLIRQRSRPSQRLLKSS